MLSFLLPLDNKIRQLRQFLSSFLRILNCHTASAGILLCRSSGNNQMWNRSRANLPEYVVQLSGRIAKAHCSDNEACTKTIHIQRIFVSGVLVASIQRGFNHSWVFSCFAVWVRFESTFFPTDDEFLRIRIFVAAKSWQLKSRSIDAGPVEWSYANGSPPNREKTKFSAFVLYVFPIHRVFTVHHKASARDDGLPLGKWVHLSNMRHLCDYFRRYH